LTLNAAGISLAPAGNPTSPWKCSSCPASASDSGSTSGGRSRTSGSRSRERGGTAGGRSGRPRRATRRKHGKDRHHRVRGRELEELLELNTSRGTSATSRARWTYGCGSAGNSAATLAGAVERHPSGLTAARGPCFGGDGSRSAALQRRRSRDYRDRAKTGCKPWAARQLCASLMGLRCATLGDATRSR
jgi:hypothetical protein